MAAIRLVHLSDIHVSAARCRYYPEDWLNKRMSAWLNLRVLGRGRKFEHAEAILGVLREELQRRPPDCLVFSGDATSMGCVEEMEAAAGLLGVNEASAFPALAVPGNHDYCTPRAVGVFEKYFAPWQVGERIDGQTYPFARRVGPVWLIGLNTAKPNFWWWDASGRADVGQLDRLRRLAQRLDGPRILVTHYPVCLASGKLENRWHRLRNYREVTQAAMDAGICLWLHGHRHDSYRHACTEWTMFPAICVGSATQNGVWAHGEYVIDGNRLEGVQRVFDPALNGFRETSRFTLALPIAR